MATFERQQKERKKERKKERYLAGKRVKERKKDICLVNE